MHLVGDRYSLSTPWPTASMSGRMKFIKKELQPFELRNNGGRRPITRPAAISPDDPPSMTVDARLPAMVNKGAVAVPVPGHQSMSWPLPQERRAGPSTATWSSIVVASQTISAYLRWDGAHTKGGRTLTLSSRLTPLGCLPGRAPGRHAGAIDRHQDGGVERRSASNGIPGGRRRKPICRFSLFRECGDGTPHSRRATLLSIWGMT